MSNKIPYRDDWPETSRALSECKAKLAAIEALVRRYNTPAVNPGAHALAGKVLRIIEGRA